MRIVQVLHGWPPDAMGGTGMYVSSLASGLRERGCTVWVAHPGPPGPVGVQESGERVVVTSPPARRWTESWRQGPACGAWRRWLRRVGADVVHIHHLAGLPLGLPAASRALGVRVVVTLHDYALPCARGQLVDRQQARCPGPEASRCATCLSDQLRLNPITALLQPVLARWPMLRARAATTLSAPRPLDRARVQARLDAVQSALSSADVVLSPSHDLLERVSTFGLPRPRWCPLPLPRPITPASPAPPGPTRFLFASSLIPTKGPHILLSAFRGLPPGSALLTIAGPSPTYALQPNFSRSLAAACQGVAGVTLRGPVPPSEMNALYESHDVFVLPSLWPENSPLTVREATAAGLPVIVSRHGGASELSSHAVSVLPGDVSSLHAAMMGFVRKGRHRLPPSSWQTPQEHADWLLREVYP